MEHINVNSKDASTFLVYTRHTHS